MGTTYGEGGLLTAPWMVPGGTNYSAVDSPGGPLLGENTYSTIVQWQLNRIYCITHTPGHVGTQIGIAISKMHYGKVDILSSKLRSLFTEGCVCFNFMG